MTQNGEKVKKQKEEAKLRKLLTAERKTELIVRELAKLQREATKVAVEQVFFLLFDVPFDN